MRISDLISMSTGDSVLNNGTYKNNPAYNDNLPVRQTQSPQTNQSAPAPAQGSVAPVPTPSVTVTLSPAAIAAALSGIKPTIETTGHTDQTYSPPKTVAAIGAAAAASMGVSAAAQKPAASGLSSLVDAVGSAIKNNGYACVGAAYGAAVGACVDSKGGVVISAGAGTPGFSVTTGGSMNSSAADHLAGWAVTAVGANGTGVAVAQGSPATVSAVVGTPGGLSATYGFAITPSTPYPEHSITPSTSYECTKAEYGNGGMSGNGCSNEISAVCGNTPGTDKVSNGGTSHHEGKNREIMAEEVEA
ncbi:hypothetical protein ACPRNU_09980 [Chromobacterium vaccinii]|uniref:hypothetical protein n=1 Tax=Chromobacterium vaccinii TaxID=1108595 RepID=UPI003C734E50